MTVMRGTRSRYPAREVMIQLLYARGVRYAGWCSLSTLQDLWDVQSSKFFMNVKSERFWRNWERDRRPDPLNGRRPWHKNLTTDQTTGDVK
jgi:hypothetical protein